MLREGTDRNGHRWGVQREHPLHEPVGWYVVPLHPNRAFGGPPCCGYHTGSGAAAKAQRDLKRHLDARCPCFASTQEGSSDA